MDAFTISSDCRHSKEGLCSKCVLNQSFAISRAEERMRSTGSCRGSDSSSDATLEREDENQILESFPSLPVKTTQPQVEAEIAQSADSYTSFAELNNCSNVQIQEESNKEHIYVTYPMYEPGSALMRLFKSDLFSPFIAIKYLFSSDDRDNRVYLGAKLFGFHTDDVDFYIPQLVNMYITDKDIAGALHPYFETRCQENVYFALLCVWLLEAFGVDRLRISDKSLAHGELLRQMICNNFQPQPEVVSLHKAQMIGTKPHKIKYSEVLSPEMLSNPLHITRSESAAASLRSLAPVSVTSEFTLDNGCRCFVDPRIDRCACGADRLAAEREFVSILMKIGSRLTEDPSKGEKTRRLVTELMRLNRSLPARVWIPFTYDHVVLRIPPNNSCVLNSKDKAPYCIYVEVLRCSDVDRVDLPRNLTDAESELHLRLRSGSTLSLNENTTHITANGSGSEGEAIEVVECQDDPNIPVAWDSMSMESSASEPALHNGRFQAELGKLKTWVNKKRPGKQRQMRPHPDDPSASTMSEPWEEKRERIRQASPYGRLPNWDLIPVIVKSGDDLAQELLAYQLLVSLKSIWEEEQVSLYLRPYKILVTSPNSGMIEPIVDACSLHQIKRNQQALFQEEGRLGVPSLESHFTENYGPKGTSSYLKAQQNFVESCAAYSLVCYFLQVKDRHNGNILIDADGHLIHIDFGFILSVSPRNLGFETSPFKLTTEMIDVMGGADSDLFLYFKTLLLKGLIAARKHHDRIMTIIEIMYKGSSLPCFRGGLAAIKAMNDRFHMTYTDGQLHNLQNILKLRNEYIDVQNMDKEKEQILGDLVFVELKVITALTVARHLNISTDEANQILKQYHEQYSKSVQAVYAVSGQMIRAGITCGAHLLAKDEELKETKSKFIRVDAVDLFAIHKNPIDELASVFAYDALQDERFFRGDAERAPIKAIQVRKLREEIQTSNKEASPRQGSIRGNTSTPMTASIKPEVKHEPVKKQTEEKNKLKTMFQKACDREKVPKNSPKKVRDSPFSSPDGVDDSPNPKKRARKILIDSEDEFTPKKKQKAPVKEEVAEQPAKLAEKKEKDKKATTSKASVPLDDDDDVYEATSPEKPSPVIAASMEKKPAKKEKKGKKIIGNGDNKDDVPVLRRSPRKIVSANGKRKVLKKDYETFIDSDGFLVTKEVLKEVEVDDDENAAPERPLTSNISHESRNVSAKSKKPTPTGQAKISSFFTRK